MLITSTEELITSNSRELFISAQDTAGQAGDFFSHLDWSAPSWDLFIILFFLIASLIYGLSLGRDRIVIILVSIYMALAVVDYAPFAEKLIEGTSLEGFFLFRVVSFIAVFLLLFFILAQSALLNTFASRNASRSWWQTIVFSILHVGLIISITLSFLPESFVNELSDFTYRLFATETARFVWIILPIIAMAFIRKPRRRRRDIDEYL
ncbi:hypothetical protein KJ840_00195 [Patescibacteria group bacterium]|nr:hypothetical protein [Patescibacteria group bacterium]